MITATEAISSISPVPHGAGDSLQSIADSHNLPLEDVQAANPGMDPGTSIAVDQTIYLPNPTDPIINPNIIQGFPPVSTEIPPAQDDPNLNPQQFNGELITLVDTSQPSGQDGQGEDNSTPGFTQFDNFKYWLQGIVNPKQNTPGTSTDENETSSGKKVYPPPEPKINVDFTGCDIKIRLQNSIVYTDPIDPLAIDQHEDGFFLYRSRDGGTFEKIATWPKITDYVDATSAPFDNPFVDANQFGVVTYYFSAFQGNSEVPGTPMSIPLDEGQCKNPNANRGGKPSAHLENGELVLPYNMDLAYFYIQQVSSNNIRTRGWRVPDGARSFLPESGVNLNLYTYLSTILDKLPDPDLDLLLQVWGWSGSKLVHAGDFQVSLHRSVLLFCSVEGEGGCTGGGGGQWLPEIAMTNDKPTNEQKYEVMWLASEVSPMKDICFQLSAGGFPNEDFWQMNLPIESYCVDIKEHQGTFLLDLGPTLYPSGGKYAGPWGNGIHSWDYSSNWFQFDYPLGKPFSLYMRTYPRLEMSGFNRYSNTAVMHYNTPLESSDMPPLASTFPSIYSIQILKDTYQPPIFETQENWGCVIIEEDPTGHYTPGTKVCPPPITAHNDCEGMSEVECLAVGGVNSLGWLYDELLFGWDGLKHAYAQWIADTIPYCGGSSGCVNIVYQAIGYAVEYETGIPANPPSSDELIADSAADFIMESVYGTETYFTEQDTSYIETFCETVVDCKKEISDRIKVEMKKLRSYQSQTSCLYPYEAYFHNVEPLCLDPSIIVHSAPGSATRPGSITVLVTRKADLPSMGAKMEDQTNYKVEVSVSGDNSTNTQSGILFPTVRADIPWIPIGSSTSITLSLYPCTNLNTCDSSYWDLMGLMYFGGTSHMKAVEACYSSNSSWPWVPCLNGGEDSWDYANPSDKLGNP
jgi:LysM repeat protein